ncbi:hypothetical protein SNE40_023138 [Patella caerulea]|uniref:Transmembrane protein n=1 Tax=Patella caerulea TaxID=87958 RepID=A0AAN8G5Q4_PATCE
MPAHYKMVLFHYLSLGLLIGILFQCNVVLSEVPSEDNQEPSKLSSKNEEGLTIESVVLGPLRVWHIVFIVCTVLIVIMVIVCCCFDFRIPRTRQEIEESYNKRLANAKYLNYLEKSPPGLVKNNQKLSKEVKAGVDGGQKPDRRPKRRPDRTSVVHAADDNDSGKSNGVRKHRRIALQETNGFNGAAVAISKKRQIGESKPRPSTVAMNKVMNSLPRGVDNQAKY